MTKLRPKIHVIGTGGTIAGVGENTLDYTRYAEKGIKLSISDSLDRIPEGLETIDLDYEDFISIGSPAIGPDQWLGLAQRVNELLDNESNDGVVITHGTATLEETAYFLHLTVKSSKPVVITGAMRPPTSLGSDADLNLLDAIRVAAHPDSSGKGVLTVLNNEIHCARDVYKSNTLRVETFRANELGFLGYSDSDGRIVYYRQPIRSHTLDTPFDVSNHDTLPRVDIVYAYGGSDRLLIDAVRENRSDGMVMSGFGSGTFPPIMLEAGSDSIKEGMAVVLASRSTAGRIVSTPRTSKLGFVVADNLHPQKARILLMLGLTITDDHDLLQKMFFEY